jgi:hypothetical protein
MAKDETLLPQGWQTRSRRSGCLWETGLSPVPLGDAIAERKMCLITARKASVSSHRQLLLQKMQHHKHVLAVSCVAVDG